MKYLILFTFLTTALFSCTETNKSDQENEAKTNDTPKTVKEEEVIDFTEKGITEVIDNLYIEYYPGKKKRIKIQGKQDANKLRDGVWLHFSYEGNELSMTTFDHGKKDGPTLVKYPNGNIHYIGQYKNNKAVGIWTTYTIEGVSSDKDFGPTGK